MPAAPRQIKGVVDVVEIPRGVAVVATNTWAAIKGKRALQIEWDESAAETRGSQELLEHYRAALEHGDAVIARNDGEADQALADAATVVEAQFEFPYLAHAALEPLNAVARMQDGVLEVWGGHQMPTLYQKVAADLAGIPPEKVKLHVMMTGGGFGRRATPDAEIIVEAVATAKAIGWRAPVKVQWTREDDMAGGRYRPIYVHRISGRAERRGQADGLAPPHRRPVDHRRIAVREHDEERRRSDLGRGRLEPAVRDPRPQGRPRHHRRRRAGAVVALGRLDPHRVFDRGDDRPARLRRQGGPRRVPARSVGGPSPPSGGARSRGRESRLGLAPAAGKARGVAVHESFHTYVAQVAEIAMRPDGTFAVERVVCAVDCGVPVNPDIIRAQMEGGIGFGLGTVLKSALHLEGGRVVETNYDTFEVLRIDGMPKVEVHIVPSKESPTGVGEPGVPPIGPARRQRLLRRHRQARDHAAVLDHSRDVVLVRRGRRGLAEPPATAARLHLPL